MSSSSPLVKVQVNIDLTPASLQAVVANAKQKAGAEHKGRYRVDTADALAALISRFLQEKGFEGYARDLSNY